MLELYHNINSVCAQKVRIALSEKGQVAKEHLLTLRGDQNASYYSTKKRAAPMAIDRPPARERENVAA